MTSPSSPSSPAVDGLLAVSDADLIAAMAKDPDFFKRAQKAMNEAKRQEAERRRSDELAQAGASIDPKIYAKAASMVQGPFNDQNNADLRSLLAGQNVNAAPPGQPSLLTLSLDYLATKQRVELSWPAILVTLGAEAGEAEMKAVKALYTQRSYGLDGFSNQLPGMIFSKKGDWAAIEAATGLTFATFLDQHANRRNLWNSTSWRGMRNLAQAGCSMPAPPNASSSPFWQSLGERALPAADPDKPSARPKAADARRECFAALIQAGWVQSGLSRLSDSLAPPAGHQGGYLACPPSMAFLQSGTVDETMLDLFTMLCQAEAKANAFHRYDDVGRSRLFFANERARHTNDPAAAAILLSIAQACLELGDKPESVNPQNPIARAANKHIGGMLASWIERAEITGVSPSSPAAAPRAPSRL